MSYNDSAGLRYHLEHQESVPGRGCCRESTCTKLQVIPFRIGIYLLDDDDDAPAFTQRS